MLGKGCAQPEVGEPVNQKLKSYPNESYHTTDVTKHHENVIVGSISHSLLAVSEYSRAN